MSTKKSNKQIVLVTGGSRGIGLETVKRFIKSGSKVYFTDLRPKKYSFKHKNLISIKCDMTKLSQINKLKRILKKEKKIDILVNNVGDAIKRSSFLESNDKLWKDSLDLNLMSAVRTTRTVLEMLKKSKNGVIINVSSVASRIGGSGDSLHYGVAKAGLNVFTTGLARELKSIRVLGIAPSAVDTDFQKRHSSKARLQKVINATPMGRIASAKEIADLVYFLSSSKASYVSGDTIFITGGR